MIVNYDDQNQVPLTEEMNCLLEVVVRIRKNL